MNKQTLFRLLAVFAVILLPFLTASPVQASKPDKIVNQYIDYSYEIDNSCGFPITAHLYGTITTKFFGYEKESQKNRVMDVWGQMKGYYEANGKILDQQASGPSHFGETENGYFAVNLGTQGLITIPGYGVVGGGAGQIIVTFEWDEAAQNYYVIDVEVVGGNFDKTDWGAICAYFDEE